MGEGFRAKVLVVDDEPGVRAAVARIVERLGHEVSEAHDGHAAMQLFEQEAHDLVITDINMPEMDGIEVILRLREDSDVPVIAMSAGGKLPAELLLENADMLGAVAAITKPFQVEELASAIRKALAR